MNKILIFGLPRTATTVIQLELVHLFDVTSLREPFCGDYIAKDVYTWAQAQQNCVMKLLTTNLCQQSTEKIDIVKLIKQGFTHVIVTQRSNLADCCASLYYAERVAQQYHYERSDTVKQVAFTVDTDFLNNWLIEVGIYYQTLNELTQNQLHYTVIDYDLYIQDHLQLVDGHELKATHSTAYVDPQIDYSNLCANYQEIKLSIEEYVKRIQH